MALETLFAFWLHLGVSLAIIIASECIEESTAQRLEAVWEAKMEPTEFQSEATSKQILVKTYIDLYSFDIVFRRSRKSQLSIRVYEKKLK